MLAAGAKKSEEEYHREDLDHLATIATQGALATSYVRDCVTHIDFLDYAMKHHGLGIHERKPYRRIEYRALEA